MQPPPDGRINQTVGPRARWKIAPHRGINLLSPVRQQTNIRRGAAWICTYTRSHYGTEVGLCTQHKCKHTMEWNEGVCARGSFIENVFISLQVMFIKFDLKTNYRKLDYIVKLYYYQNWCLFCLQWLMTSLLVNVNLFIHIMQYGAKIREH